MGSMVEFILNGETVLSAVVLVRLIVFSLTMECIGEIAHAITSIGRR